MCQLEPEAQSWWLTSQATRGSAEEPVIVWGLGISKPIPTGMLPLVKTHFLNLLKQYHQRGISVQMPRPYGNALSLTAVKSVIILWAKNKFSRQTLFYIELLLQLVEIKQVTVDNIDYRPIRKLAMVFPPRAIACNLASKTMSIHKKT